MKTELEKQKDFWNKEIGAFDSIYSHEKSTFSAWLDAKFRWDMYARYEYTFAHSEPITGRSILDVGCGTGRFSLEYARRNAKNVMGIDISDQMVSTCIKRAKEENLDKQCTFLKTDLLDFQPKELYDIAIGIGLFDYIKEPQNVITKMRNSVKDRVIMSFPRLWTWRAPVRKVRLAMQSCDVYFYTKGDIKTLITNAGFKKFELDVVGKLYCVTAFV